MIKRSFMFILLMLVAVALLLSSCGDESKEVNTQDERTSETKTELTTDKEQVTEEQVTEEQATEEQATEDKTEAPTAAECKHQYDEGSVDVAASCTKEGSMLFICTQCGAEKRESIDATGHSYDAGSVIKEATCYEEGILRKECDFCEHNVDEVISKSEVHSCKGMIFSSEQRNPMGQLFGSFPKTFDVVFSLDKAENSSKSYGLLLSNNDHWNPSVSYEINKNGSPQIVLQGWKENSAGARWFTSATYVFDDVNVCMGKPVHMSIVIDTDNAKAHCYIDGELKQTLEKIKNLDIDRTSIMPYVVGGDHLGSNYAHFTGEIYELSVWSDIRSADEIAATCKSGVALDDAALIVRYELYSCRGADIAKDLSHLKNDFETVKLWLDPSEVEDADGDYCFAVIGDTQSLSQFHPDSMAGLYDWLLENKDEINIQYAIGVGDITENALESEFNFARENIYKLSGKIPFSLSMGNHDKYDFKNEGYVAPNASDFLFNKTFYNDTYLAELDGWYGEGDVSCSYNAFEIGTTKWLILNLDFSPTDEVLEWAGNVVEAHPDHKVIVATHAYMYRDGSTLDSEDCYAPSRYNPIFNDGDEIFDKFISKYENIEIVLAGHDPWDHIVCSQVKGEHGNTVTQILVDPQYMDRFYGATGMVALLYFSEDASTLTVRYYSTVMGMYGSELSQFTVTLD